MHTITIHIEGMHCGSCEALVREALEELDSVESVDVSHSRGTAKIVYDESAVSPETLKAAVEQQGYAVSG